MLPSLSNFQNIKKKSAKINIFLNPSSKIPLKAEEEQARPPQVSKHDPGDWHEVKGEKAKTGRNCHSLSTESVPFRKGGGEPNKENSCEQLKSSTSTGAKCSCSNEMHTQVPRSGTGLPLQGRLRRKAVLQTTAPHRETGLPTEIRQPTLTPFCHRKKTVQGHV